MISAFAAGTTPVKRSPEIAPSSANFAACSTERARWLRLDATDFLHANSPSPTKPTLRSLASARSQLTMFHLLTPSGRHTFSNAFAFASDTTRSLASFEFITQGHRQWRRRTRYTGESFV